MKINRGSSLVGSLVLAAREGARACHLRWSLQIRRSLAVLTWPGPRPGPGLPQLYGPVRFLTGRRNVAASELALTHWQHWHRDRKSTGCHSLRPGLPVPELMMPPCASESCCNHCIQLRTMVHLAPTENAATLKVIIEQKGAGEQTLGATSRDKAQTDSE